MGGPAATLCRMKGTVNERRKPSGSLEEFKDKTLAVDASALMYGCVESSSIISTNQNAVPARGHMRAKALAAPTFLPTFSFTEG